MKGGREHRVPLSERALELLQAIAARAKQSVYLHRPARRQRSLNMAMAAVLKRMGRDDITVHGFRSAFRDWAAERTNYPNHVVEMALAHAVGDKVEAAYRRGDLFAQARGADGGVGDPIADRRDAPAVPMWWCRCEGGGNDEASSGSRARRSTMTHPTSSSSTATNWRKAAVSTGCCCLVSQLGRTMVTSSWILIPRTAKWLVALDEAEVGDKSTLVALLKSGSIRTKSSRTSPI